jgi:hypothetical protein
VIVIEHHQAVACDRVAAGRIVIFVTAQAQGWYLDPYGAHEERYFSAGHATALVRDGREESRDPPPPGRADPVPASLVAAPEHGYQAADASDMRRADDVNRSYIPLTRTAAMRAARWFRFYGYTRR